MSSTTSAVGRTVGIATSRWHGQATVSPRRERPDRSLFSWARRTNSESPFIENLRRAFEQKCPKLARCKGLDSDVVTVLIFEAIDLPFHYDRYIAESLGALLEGCGVEPDQIFLVYPHAAFWEVWVVKRNDVQWPDERLSMPHKGYQDPPKLIPEDAYPRQFVELFNRDVGRERPARWRPLVLAEAELQDAKKGVAPIPACRGRDRK